MKVDHFGPLFFDIMIIQSNSKNTEDINLDVFFILEKNTNEETSNNDKQPITKNKKANKKEEN